MSNYKVSQFNIEVDLEDGALLLHNLFTNKLMHVSQEKKEVVKSVLANLQDNFKSEYIEQLYNDGFLVNKDRIEHQYVDFIRNEVVYSTEHLGLVIIPTNDCNFRCTYCYEEHVDRVMSNETVESIMKFLDYNMRKYRTVHIDWFGGEPLLQKEIIYKILEKACFFAKRDKVVFTSGITTNGYELDLETYNKLVNYRMTWFQITIDGTKESHNRHRPHYRDSDSFTKIINNLRAIRDHSKPSNLIKIYYRINVDDFILHSSDEILSFYKMEFAMDKRFEILPFPVSNWGKEGKMMGVNKTVFGGTNFIDFIKLFKIYGLKPFLSFSDFSNKIICYASKKSSFVIGSDSNIYRCTLSMFYNNVNKLIQSQIGQMLADGTMKFDDECNVSWIESKNNFSKKCTQCKYYTICLGSTRCPKAVICKEQSCPINEIREVIDLEIIFQYYAGNIDNKII